MKYLITISLIFMLSGCIADRLIHVDSEKLLKHEKACDNNKGVRHSSLRHDRYGIPYSITVECNNGATFKSRWEEPNE